MAPSDPRNHLETLLHLAIQGDRDAVAEILRAFLPRVYGLCLRLSRDRDLAEEATQETMVRALRALPGLKNRGSFPAWILTIAANTSKELLRQRPEGNTLDLEIIPGPPDESGEREIRQRAVEDAIGKLGMEERELFLLHTVEGIALEELAREQQVSQAAMKSRLHRIREKVRGLAQAHLEKEGELP